MKKIFQNVVGALLLLVLAALPLSAVSQWTTEPYDPSMFVLVPGGQWTVPIGGYFNNDWTPTDGGAVFWRVHLNGTKSGPNGQRVVLRLPNGFHLAAKCVMPITIFTNGIRQAGFLEGFAGDTTVSLYVNTGVFTAGVVDIKFTTVCEVQ